MKVEDFGDDDDGDDDDGDDDDFTVTVKVATCLDDVVAVAPAAREERSPSCKVRARV